MLLEDHFLTGDLVGRALPGETAKSARSRPGSELVSEIFFCMMTFCVLGMM